MSKKLKSTTIWEFVKLKDTKQYRVFHAKEGSDPDFNKLYISLKDSVAQEEVIEVEVRRID